MDRSRRRHGQRGHVLRDARSTFKDCKDSCTSDFLDAKASCLNIDAGCFLACRDGREECVATASQPLTDCLATCDPPLDAARATCRTPPPCSCGGSGDPCGFDPCFISCITPAEDKAFQCRNGCRNDFKLNTTAQQDLTACKSGFQAYLQSCPPAATP